MTTGNAKGALPGIRVRVAPSKYIGSWIIGFGCLLMRLLQSQSQRGTEASSKRVVIVEPYGMGDVIALDALVAQLLQAGIEVTVMCQERWHELLPGSRCIAMEKNWQQLGFFGFLRTVRAQRAENKLRFKGAVGIDPRGDVRSIFLLRAVGCTPVYALDRFLGSNLRVPRGIARLVPERSTTEMRWENNLGFLAGLGVSQVEKRPPQLTHLGERTEVVAGRIGLMAVAPWPGRLWTAEGWSTVIRYLKERGLRPALICGPGQEREAKQATGSTVDEVLAASDVRSLAGVIASCEAILTLDSGPMHLASALEKPLVALFGPGQLPLWAPFSPNMKVVVSPLAANGPIHQVDANIELGKKMMRAIRADEVILAFEEVCGAFAKDGRFSNSVGLSNVSN